MKQKSTTNILLVILAIIVIGGVAGYFVLFQTPEHTPTTTTSSISAQTPILSEDRKEIVADGKILLIIDDDAIFNFFKTKSQLCDEYNITTTPDREIFCENKRTFKSMTSFTSIVVSPDKTKIGFTIESDTLSPDKVVGIFYLSRATDKMYFLTNYYLGNEFISFSPSGKHFVYQGSCWEGMCGLYVKDSETLADKLSLNSSEYVDYRSDDSKFVRWLSDNEVEYKLGTGLKRASF